MRTSTFTLHPHRVSLDGRGCRGRRELPGGRGSAMASRLVMLLVLTVLLAGVAGCQPAQAERDFLGAQAVPPDFALQFTVYNPHTPDTRDPAQQPSQYVLEANRRLRIAVGAGATQRVFPESTRAIASSDVRHLWEHIETFSLMSEPSAAPRDAAPPRSPQDAAADAGTPPPGAAQDRSDAAADATATRAAADGAAPATPGPHYRVVITARSQTHTYTTTPQASPPTADLLHRLIRLRKGYPPDRADLPAAD